MKIRVEVEVGPAELREFLGLPDVAGVQEEALALLSRKLRSGAAGTGDAVAVLRGMLPESLFSIGEWQRLIGRALQTGRPVTFETTMKPEPPGTGGGRSASAQPRKRAARKKAT
jgi:hypothetical protein